jgi:hypothetical protein
MVKIWLYTLKKDGNVFNVGKVAHNLCNVVDRTNFYILNGIGGYKWKEREGILFLYKISELCILNKKWKSVH